MRVSGRAVTRAVATRSSLTPGRRPRRRPPCRSRAVTMQRHPDLPVSNRHQSPLTSRAPARTYRPRSRLAWVFWFRPLKFRLPAPPLEWSPTAPWTSPSTATAGARRQLLWKTSTPCELEDALDPTSSRRWPGSRAGSLTSERASRSNFQPTSSIAERPSGRSIGTWRPHFRRLASTPATMSRA